MATGEKANYGVDAPGLVRTFFVVGTISASALCVILLAGLTNSLWGAALGFLFAIVTTYTLGMGIFMLYGSLVKKVADRESLLHQMTWNKRDVVLDIGCGRGLLLIGAAKIATEGRAIGIDSWQASDQSGNSSEAAIANARLESVSERVDVRTADACELPFDDNYFDKILSHWVIHNIEEPIKRKMALSEIDRTLKPGGQLLLADIACHSEYVEFFTNMGYNEIQEKYSPFWDAVRGCISFGSFRPRTLYCHKPSEQCHALQPDISRVS